jgi:hypothetical protein
VRTQNDPEELLTPIDGDIGVRGGAEACKSGRNECKQACERSKHEGKIHD